ncbi:hypothetical protein GCM10023215_56030 [Pseudonocardia yuanmonensis]|uniref:Uncharacterized protein n=1 Tax=Pseudonocardia yuanmonensis TaxID=1095914 RepID=A0ABP8XJX9_9PSEU
MVARVVTVRGDSTGVWRVEDPSSSASRPVFLTHSAAVEYARARLARTGGSLVVVNSLGQTTTHFVAQPTWNETLQASYSDDTEKRLSELGNLSDQILGREKTESGLGELGGANPRDYLPPMIKNQAGVQQAGQAVGWGTLGLAVVGFVLGTGATSTVTSAVSTAIRSTPSIDDYVTFFQAFMATLPWSVSFAIGVWMLLTGNFTNKGWGPVIAWVLGSVACTWIVTSIGAATGPTLQMMLEYMNEAGSSPLHKALGLLGAYLAFYTLIPFLGGAITGASVGWWFVKRTHPDPV